MTASLHVTVLIDALGWPLAERFSFMTDALPYRTKLRTVLGYSSGAIPTMLTGKVPADHGHWNLFYYDPARSPFRWLRPARMLPPRVLDNRIGRKVIKELGKRALGLGPLFDCAVSPALLPWFDWVEKKNIYEPGGINGASSIFDELTAAKIPYRAYTYHRLTDAAILEQARRDIAEGAASYFFLYLSEVDGLLHHHCTDLGLIAERLAWYDAELRHVLRVARDRDPDAGMTIFSDHGMAPVRHHHNLAADIDVLGLAMPDEYLAIYDSTMARFWFFSDVARTRVVERLASLTCGRTLGRDEVKDLGIEFADRRYGDLIFLMHPGWLITSSDFNASWQPAGMHGYHPDDPDSDAVFLSDREPSRPLRTIADAHDCMRAAAGLRGEALEARL